MTLRGADISEEVITCFRVHKIKNAAIFAEELKETVREAFQHRYGEVWLTSQCGVGQHSQRLVGSEG